MAKNATKKVGGKSTKKLGTAKPVLFYADATKLARAEAQAANSGRSVLEYYKQFGGAFSEGHGIRPVEEVKLGKKLGAKKPSAKKKAK